MNRFHNILVVIQGDASDSQKLFAALKPLAGSASLHVLILQPELPRELEDVQSVFQSSTEDTIRASLEKSGLAGDYSVTFETAKPYAVSIIRFALRKECDLVIKRAGDADQGQQRGFRSIDMSLLRKCPVPLWLVRDTAGTEPPRILTAVDPASQPEENYELSIKLLKTGALLAKLCGGQHTVVSCWELDYESYLRHSAFARIDNAKVDRLLAETEQDHTSALKRIVEAAAIDAPDVLCRRGRAENIIPALVDSGKADLVVMGTVARTGISGFIMGNTAENVLQELSCSMFAVKPAGFVSPVKR